MNRPNFSKNFSRTKAANGFLLLGVFAIMVTVFFSSESIRAQMMGLYDQKSDDVVGISALMSAVSSNDITGVKFFSKASSLINQKNIGGATALHIACREKNFEIAKILIESGADLNVTDNEGWTPLMRASLAGDKEIVNLLLTKGVRANEINSAGESAIIHAALSDCVDCLNSMFAKFNFIRSVNITFLQAQLTEAFVIAKNHDNQPMQVAIEAYLDRVIKMMAMVENIQKKVEGSSTVFKVSSLEGVEKPAPMLVKKSPANAVVTTRFKLMSGAVQQQRPIPPKENKVNKFSIKKSVEPQEVVPKIIFVPQKVVPEKVVPQKIIPVKKDFKFLGKVKNPVVAPVVAFAPVTNPKIIPPSKPYVVTPPKTYVAPKPQTYVAPKTYKTVDQVPDQVKDKMMIYLIKNEASAPPAKIIPASNVKEAQDEGQKEGQKEGNSFFKFAQGEVAKEQVNKVVKIPVKVVKKPVYVSEKVEKKTISESEKVEKKPVATSGKNLKEPLQREYLVDQVKTSPPATEYNGKTMTIDLSK